MIWSTMKHNGCSEDSVFFPNYRQNLYVDAIQNVMVRRGRWFLKETLLESRMMREVSRPVRRKEIGDVLRCSNAPISYPTRDVPHR